MVERISDRARRMNWWNRCCRRCGHHHRPDGDAEGAAGRGRRSCGQSSTSRQTGNPTSTMRRRKGAGHLRAVGGTCHGAGRGGILPRTGHRLARGLPEGGSAVSKRPVKNMVLPATGKPTVSTTHPFGADRLRQSRPGTGAVAATVRLVQKDHRAFDPWLSDRYLQDPGCRLRRRREQLAGGQPVHVSSSPA